MAATKKKQSKAAENRARKVLDMAVDGEVNVPSLEKAVVAAGKQEAKPKKGGPKGREVGSHNAMDIRRYQLSEAARIVLHGPFEEQYYIVLKAPFFSTLVCRFGEPIIEILTYLDGTTTVYGLERRVRKRVRATGMLIPDEEALSISNDEVDSIIEASKPKKPRPKRRRNVEPSVELDVGLEGEAADEVERLVGEGLSPSDAEFEIEADVEPEDAAESDEKAPERPARGKRGKKDAGGSQKPKGRPQKPRKPRVKASPATEEPEPDDEPVVTEPEIVETPDAPDDYESMTAVSLYKLCKERGIDVKQRQRQRVYIDALREADRAAAEAEEESVEADEFDDDDDDWDI